MKALIICRMERTKMMVDIASILQENNQLDEVSAFVSYYDKWKKYLKSQSKLKIKDIFGTDAIFKRMGKEKYNIDQIKRIENTYGKAEIWNIVYTESYLTPHTHPQIFTNPIYSDDELLSYVQFTFEYAEEMLKDVDAIIDFAHVNIFRGIFDLVAQKMNIPFLYPIHTIVKNKYTVGVRVNEEFEIIRKEYQELMNNNDPCLKGKEILDWFRGGEEKCIYGGFGAGPWLNKKKVSRNIFQILSKKYWQKIFIYKILAQIRYEFKLRMAARTNPEKKYNFILYKGTYSKTFLRDFYKWIRLSWVKINKPYFSGDCTHPYAFFTLHWQPEAATSIRSPYFVNQLSVIENISRAMPLDWKLVVKPNPAMAKGIDPIEFIQKIKRIPNVLLVEPNSSTRNWIMKSKVVITISGTSAFEAVLLGKKAILFGNEGVIWHMLKDVIKCTDITKLYSIIKSLDKYTINDDSLCAYLEAINSNSIDMKFNSIWESSYDWSVKEYQEEIKELTQAIFQRYQEYKKSSAPKNKLSSAVN